MNKKKFQRIISMYRDGASLETCVSAIVELSTNTPEIAIFTSKFFKEVWSKHYKAEIIQLKDIIKGLQYELSIRKESPNVEDK